MNSPDIFIIMVRESTRRGAIAARGVAGNMLHSSQDFPRNECQKICETWALNSTAFCVVSWYVFSLERFRIGGEISGQVGGGKRKTETPSGSRLVNKRNYTGWKSPRTAWGLLISKYGEHELRTNQGLFEFTTIAAVREGEIFHARFLQDSRDPTNRGKGSFTSADELLNALLP